MMHLAQCFAWIWTAAETADPAASPVRMGDAVVEAWLNFLVWVGQVFDPVVRPLFQPINTLLENTYMPWARICAMGMFVATLLWVWLILKKEYVNRGRQDSTWWTDLRLWTILCLLPHIFVYLYF